METIRSVVTGGAGFIGSHLVDRLLQANHQVVVVDDLSTGDLSNLAEPLANDAITFVQADVRDEAAMQSALRGADLVFHLATRNVRLSLTHPTLVHDVNTTGTYNVLKAAAATGVRRFLYCSSSEVNGTADVVPMPEDYHFRPETIYGASKLAGEYYTQVFHRAQWLSTIIARPHNNYGPREHYAGNKGEVIPRFIIWALAGAPLLIYGDGQQTRDFTYVAETADYLFRLSQCDAALGQTFNVCRGEEVSILRIAELILELTGSRSEIRMLPGRPSDVRRLYGDPGRLKETLGSSPQISIVDGLARMIEWFRKHVKITPALLESLDARAWQHQQPEPFLAAVANARAWKAGAA